MDLIAYDEIKKRYKEKLVDLRNSHSKAESDDALKSPRREQIAFLNLVIEKLDANAVDKAPTKAMKLTAMFLLVEYSIYYHEYGNKKLDDNTNSQPFLTEFAKGKRPTGYLASNPEKSLLYKQIPEIIGLSPLNKLDYDSARKIFTAGMSFLTSQIYVDGKADSKYDITSPFLAIKNDMGFDVRAFERSCAVLRDKAHLLSSDVKSAEAAKEIEAKNPEKPSKGWGIFGGAKSTPEKKPEATATAQP